MPMNPPVRVLLAKIGLDGHDRGFRLIGCALRDAGMEVILGGPWCTVDEVVVTAAQEDLEVIAISSLSFDHLLIPKLMDRIKSEGLDVLVVVGGIVPHEDVPGLLACGVSRVFHPGSTLKSVVEFIETEAAARRAVGLEKDEFRFAVESR
jgi:methylmalonyl-CoA mutase, C-terminal domain